MSYNGSGTFNINTAGQPVVTGTVISSTAFNALTADLATGLSTAITKNGQTTVTANIPFNNFKLTGIGVATATGDALSYGQAATVTSLVASTSITDSGLTSGRLTYASTGGLLADSASLTWDGSYLTASSIKDTALTSGRVTYAGASGLLQDSANLTFNGTTLTAAGFSGPLNGTVGATTPSTGAFTTLSSSGAYTAAANIGITRTPLSSTSSVFKTLEIGAAGTGTTTFFGQTNVSAGGISTNSIFDASNNYVYATSAPVSNLYMYNGSTSIQYAAAGTAGNTFTPTTIATFSSTGLAVTGYGSHTGSVSVGGATPAASGTGITFPATQSASSDANTLDDYEEGTFNPTISGSTTAGAGTYTFYDGRYTKIGRQVYVEGALIWTAHTGTGNLLISNLPFACNATQYSGVTLVKVANLTTTANNQLICRLVANSTTAEFAQIPSGGGAEGTLPIDTAATIYFSATYTV